MPQKSAVVSHTVRSDAPPTVPYIAPSGPAQPAITNKRPDEMAEALQGGWISSSQSAATVSGLIAATDAQLLVFMRTPVDPTDSLSVHSTAREVMLGFIYLGLFFSISATISQLVMTGKVVERPENVAHKSGGEGYSAPASSRSMDTVDRLVRYGVDIELKYVSLHWLFCFLTGMSSTVTSVLIYVWIEESQWLKIVLTAAAFYTGLPFLHYLPFFRDRRAAALAARQKATAQNVSLSPRL